jgi:hypothetical protein
MSDDVMKDYKQKLRDRQDSPTQGLFIINRCDERLKTRGTRELGGEHLRTFITLMILLQQNKKRRETGKKCHARSMIHSKPVNL